MKKQVSMALSLLSLAAAVFFSVLAGRQFLSVAAGPEAVPEGSPVETMRGEYITYSVAHPVACFAEEYYSGNERRVSKYAYVTYDRERRIFLKIVVPERKNIKFEYLMRAVNRSAELKESWGDRQEEEERPVEVTGSLMLIEDPDETGRILEALMGEDSHSTEEMDELALAQTDWYMIEDGIVGGIPVSNVRICIVSAGLNLLVFLLCLVSLAKKSQVSDGRKSAGDAVGQLLEWQRVWLAPWCEEGRKRQNRLVVLGMAGAVAALMAVGFFAGYPVSYVLTCHLPVGLAAGEIFGVPVLMGAGGYLNPDKILRACRKSLEREIPQQEKREAMARELLDTEKQWAVLETGKDDARYGIAGEHYWMVLSGRGMAVVAEADRIKKIGSETVTGQVRSGKVRMAYTYYSIMIDYWDSQKKKGHDVVINFDGEDTAGHFITLARKRLGERAAEVVE